MRFRYACIVILLLSLLEYGCKKPPLTKITGTYVLSGVVISLDTFTVSNCGSTHPIHNDTVLVCDAGNNTISFGCQPLPPGGGFIYNASLNNSKGYCFVDLVQPTNSEIYDDTAWFDVKNGTIYIDGINANIPCSYQDIEFGNKIR
jgi:hypothetical protein